MQVHDIRQMIALVQLYAILSTFIIQDVWLLW